MFKRILLLIFTNFILTATFFSQPPPPAPPPPPLIFDAPTINEIKEFKDESYGFKADFPGIPQNLKGKLIDANENVFKTKYKGSEATVRIIDFDFNVEKSVDSNEIFELFKEKYLSQSGNEIVSEKNVSFNGKNAKDFEIKDTFHFNKIRVIVNEDRIYEIFINVTNWHILSQHYPEKVKAFQGEAERFHNSFQFTAATNRTPNQTVKKFEKGKFDLFPVKEESGIGGTIIKSAKPFDSKEGGFKIMFPGEPTKKINNFQSGFGPAEMHQYSLGTALAYYGVNYFDFPTIIDDKAELKLRYRMIKDNILKQTNSSLISENELYFGENFGYELVIGSNDMTMDIRLIMVKQRLFQLVVVTQGKSNTTSQTLKSYKKGIRDNFFNSFEVTNLPEVKSQSVSLPKDFGVSTENNLLKIDFFAFSMNLPEKWNILSSQQTQLVKELGKESLQEKKNSDVYNLSFQNTEILIMLSKNEIEKAINNSVFVISAEKVAFPNFLAKNAIETAMKTFIEEDEKLVKGPNSEIISGVEFYWIEIKNETDGSFQRLYVANRKGIMFQIYFNYTDSKDLDSLVKSLGTVKFEQISK